MISTTRSGSTSPAAEHFEIILHPLVLGADGDGPDIAVLQLVAHRHGGGFSVPAEAAGDAVGVGVAVDQVHGGDIFASADADDHFLPVQGITVRSHTAVADGVQIHKHPSWDHYTETSRNFPAP